MGKFRVFFGEDVLQNLCSTDSTHSLSGVSSQSCDDACEAVSGICDLDTMKSATQTDLEKAFTNLNTGYQVLTTQVFQASGVPQRSKNLGILYFHGFDWGGGQQAQLFLISDRSFMNCAVSGGGDAIPGRTLQRMCSCIVQNNDPGIVNGDPHIQTLHGRSLHVAARGHFQGLELQERTSGLGAVGCLWRAQVGQIWADKT